MINTTLDVLCIGNAIVDVITDADDAFLANQSLDKGAKRLIDEAEAVRLYGVMGPGREVSGGSAGNTAAGLAALGIRTGFIGQVADDQLGKIYQHDIEAQGIDFLVPARSDPGSGRTSCPETRQTRRDSRGGSRPARPVRWDRG